jgi:hypothetical protein
MQGCKANVSSSSLDSGAKPTKPEPALPAHQRKNQNGLSSKQTGTGSPQMAEAEDRRAIQHS